MHKYLSEYMSRIQAQLSEDAISDYDALIASHLNKIQFMQHERLIHFLVTMLFALVLFVCLGIFVVTQAGMMLPLLGLILVLLVPYIMHYYFLENTVQKMYVVYDQLLSKKAAQDARTEESVTC